MNETNLSASVLSLGKTSLSERLTRSAKFFPDSPRRHHRPSDARHIWSVDHDPQLGTPLIMKLF